MADEPTEKRAAAHLRALDEQLEQLRRLDAALGARTKREQDELRALKERLARLADGSDR